MTNNAEREAFEKWARKTYSVERHCGLRDQYAAVGVECAWRAWQARAQASGVPDSESVGYIEFLDRQNNRLRRCLGFFASVIKSGESWSDTCQSEYDEAIRSDIAPTPPKSASVPVERLEGLLESLKSVPVSQEWIYGALEELIAEYKP